MSELPDHTHYYFLPKVGTYRDLDIKRAPVSKPKANEVLVKVRAVSLQYRDYSVSVGKYDIGVYENIIPCSDMAGEVLCVGEDVKNWKKGDRVCSNFMTGYLDGPLTPEAVQTSLGGQSPGVLTQYRCFPEHALVRIPAHLDYLQASTLPCAALTAYNGLHGPNRLKAGDYVLVLGSGGVSIFALQFAVASGAIVIATSSSDDKLRIASKLGAKHLINYKKTPDWHKEVMKITGGVGVDHVIEVGGSGTYEKSINSVRHGGEVAVIGFVAEGTSGNPLVSILMKAIEVRGVYVGSVSLFKNMIRLMEANPLKTEPVIDKVFRFADAVAAYAYLESQKHVGKVVIEVSHQIPAGFVPGP
ncbi:hypothetical protein D9611_010026 [Ephemerocybe angulata]|uniref:Enoyl reductase (ER) domain-containing protein n=1 Tax=Ephemerocybe angulata TaxID=980116 RepID=A0A8H5C4A5_9AGAR|nr:hypothetical protein D9611_010026 [Tulosesus angulatus]